MAKASITKKFSLSANGLLGVDGDVIGIENPDTGEFIDLKKLLSEFENKPVKLSITYDYDYGDNN